MSKRPFQPDAIFQSYSQSNAHLASLDGNAWCNSRIQGWIIQTSLDAHHAVDCGRCAARLASEPARQPEPAPVRSTGEPCDGCGRRGSDHWEHCQIAPKA